jgi:hypothetical protein
MSITGKKAEIEKRLRLAKYPRRNASAVARGPFDAGPQLIFTEENNHNPLVLEDCPECHGRGRGCDETGGAAVTTECTHCAGLGTTTDLVPCFANDDAEQEGVVDVDGFVTCPCCERRFSTRDGDRWTGRRHRGCGQLIKLRSPVSE